MKKSFRKIACLIAIAATTMGATMAQEAEPATAGNKKLEFSVHLGGSIPMGGFETCDEELPPFMVLGHNNYAQANMGLNLGGKIKYNISPNNRFGFMATIDLFYNSAFSYAKDYKDVEDIPSYINIPLMLGINYDYNITTDLSIWGEAGVGANLRIITPWTGKDSTGSIDYDYLDSEELVYEYKYDNAITLAAQVGLGAKLMDKFSLGIHYYYLGYDVVHGTVNYETNHTGEIEVNKSVFKGIIVNTSMLVVRMGYHF